MLNAYFKIITENGAWYDLGKIINDVISDEFKLKKLISLTFQTSSPQSFRREQIPR